MSITIIAMLASAQALPWLDRASLERQARSEALRPKVAAMTGAGGAKRPAARRLLSEDIGTISTVCRAAAKDVNPDQFIGRLGEAFAMPAAEVKALRKTCGVYLTGMIDGNR
jgi:shikimate 5-dehydrogenase